MFLKNSDNLREGILLNEFNLKEYVLVRLYTYEAANLEITYILIHNNLFGILIT